MKPMIHEETWPYIDEYLRTMPEVLQKLPTFLDALAATEERGEERGEQLGALHARCETLLSLLQHKFGALPVAIIKQVNATTKLTQLDQWLLQVLDAGELTAIDWESATTGNGDKNA